jgi:predicted RNA-binding protein associated with RNAse of E/G family
VTYLPAAGVDRPVAVAGETVLDPASPVVWFTFPGLWHDIGRFHREDGTFTGIYANILTPVERRMDVWETTDLFLDVFLAPDGGVHVLDRDELERAESRGWVDVGMAHRARAEAERLVAAAAAGTWPPPVVRAWSLERARRVAEGTPGTPPVYRGRHGAQP